jgi:hypothetical protein
MGASQVPFVTCRVGFARESESTNSAWGNLVNKGQLSSRFYRGDNELDMNLRMTHREPHHISSLPIKTLHHARDARSVNRTSSLKKAFHASVEKSPHGRSRRRQRGEYPATRR